MNDKKFFSLLEELWRDFSHPGFYWVALGLAAILVLSWWLSNRLRLRTEKQGQLSRGTLKSFGAGGIKRVAFPLIAYGMVLLLRQVLLATGWGFTSLLFIAAPLLLAWALIRLLVYILRRVFTQGKWLAGFERWITFAIWCWLALEITGMSDYVVELLEQVSFSVGRQRLNLWLLIHGVVTVGLTLLIALWVASLIESRLQTVSELDGNVREVVVRVAKALLSVLALLGSLSLVGIDITALSVFGGALAVGLGFGLQKIASNYVSGFILLLDRSIRIGNLVALDDQTTGTVTQITTRYTVIRTLTGTEIIVPNEYLVSNVIRNQSFTDTRVRLTVSIQVAYNSDLDLAMSLMVEAASRQMRVLEEPPPMVLLTAFAESGINLELGFWVADPEEGTGRLRSEISLAIWDAFRARGIEIPFPQREIRILGAAPVV